MQHLTASRVLKALKSEPDQFEYSRNKGWIIAHDPVSRLSTHNRVTGKPSDPETVRNLAIEIKEEIARFSSEPRDEDDE